MNYMKILKHKITFKDSLRKRGRQSLLNLTNEAVQSMSGSGLPKSKRRRVQSKSKTRGVKKSIKKAPRKKSAKTRKTKKSKKSKIPADSRFAYL